jgi:hypothetical protein
MNGAMRGPLAAGLLCGLLATGLLAASVSAGCGRRSSGADWSEHMGRVKFTVGWEKGLAAAAPAKKPLAILFAADW